MRQNCKNKIISIIKSIKNLEQNKKCPQAMLIVDQHTSPLLSSVVYYFFALGVKNITKINLKKKPEPHCIGIYYLSPSSLKLINDDFKGQPIYHSINILLNEEATPEIINLLVSQAKIMERLAFFGQLKLGTKYLDNNIGIICEEQHLFKSLMRNQQKRSITEFGNKLFQSVVSGYGNKFVLKVYYQQNQHISQIMKILGERYKEHMNYQENKENTQSMEQQQQKSVSLLLVDRKIDLVSPIVRNFYFFSMVSELFNVDHHNTKINLKMQEKTIELSFEDAIFNEYKNLHISKAQNLIEPSFKKFKAENKAAQLNKQKNLQGVQIKHIIRDIPEYNKKVTSYQSQISLMYEISTMSKQQGIPEIGQVQQMIVSGISGHGQQMKDKKIYQRAMELCQKLQTQNCIVKIWLLLLFCNDLSESDKKGIISKIKQLPAYHNLGLMLQSKLSVLAPKPLKLKPLFKKQKVFLDLHECLVTAIISQITQKGTSKLVNFAMIGEQIKKNESKFQKIGKKQQKQWLICMFGGLSINEICQLQRLQTTYQSIKINMLTDRVFTTWNYIKELEGLFI